MQLTWNFCSVFSNHGNNFKRTNLNNLTDNIYIYATYHKNTLYTVPSKLTKKNIRYPQIFKLNIQSWREKTKTHTCCREKFKFVWMYGCSVWTSWRAEWEVDENLRTVLSKKQFKLIHQIIFNGSIDLNTLQKFITIIEKISIQIFLNMKTQSLKLP